MPRWTLERRLEAAHEQLAHYEARIRQLETRANWVKATIAAIEKEIEDSHEGGHH